MEELFLSSFLAGEKLNVVHQKHVDVSVLVSKTYRLIVSDCIDQFVHESLRRQIGQSKIGIALLY